MTEQSSATEQLLEGGRTFGAVRVGDTVRRPATPWTASVRSVLQLLERNNFAGAPRFLGVDEQGREIQSYLPGETVGTQLPWPPWVWADSTLQQVGKWLRALHDITATFVAAPDDRWFGGQSWHPGLVIGHHDAAPYNAVWNGDLLVGFVDWDTAGPSSRGLDLAWSALFWVPLHARNLAEQVGFTDFDNRSRRLHLLLDAYGYAESRVEFAALVQRRVAITSDAIRGRAAAGDPVYAAMLPTADELDVAAREIRELPAAFWLPPAG